jgi:hypothetical protein
MWLIFTSKMVNWRSTGTAVTMSGVLPWVQVMDKNSSITNSGTGTAFLWNWISISNPLVTTRLLSCGIGFQSETHWWLPGWWFYWRRCCNALKWVQCLKVKLLLLTSCRTLIHISIECHCTKEDYWSTIQWFIWLWTPAKQVILRQGPCFEEPN